jgi:hypothetical protein
MVELTLVSNVRSLHGTYMADVQSMHQDVMDVLCVLLRTAYNQTVCNGVWARR